MKKIIGCLLVLGLFFSPGAFAENDQFIWSTKPVLCGDTLKLLKDFEKNEFEIIAKSTIINAENKIVGNIFYLAKDDDLALIEISRIGSCIISMSKNFTLFKRNKVKDF